MATLTVLPQVAELRKQEKNQNNLKDNCYPAGKGAKLGGEMGQTVLGAPQGGTSLGHFLLTSANKPWWQGSASGWAELLPGLPRLG